MEKGCQKRKKIAVTGKKDFVDWGLREQKKGNGDGTIKTIQETGELGKKTIHYQNHGPEEMVQE